MNKKNYYLVIAIILIVGSIYSIESNKPKGDVKVSFKEEQGLVAPELQGIKGYINTDGITIKENKGKVVLIDFWTYSCINCIRTLPFLKDWNEKYKDKGLVIIGVHSPEFGFEKKIENVKNEVEKNGITYPVVLDNDFATWRAYQNSYWPRKYLIDQNGYIVYNHIGEGGYGETEKKIQELLKVKENLSNVQSDNVLPRNIGTPEIYFGYIFRRGNFGQSDFTPNRVVDYALPEQIQKNLVFLQGSWLNKADHMELQSETGKVVLFYRAKNVNIVASSDPKTNLRIKLDGNFLKEEELGQHATIENGESISDIQEETLYNVVSDINYTKRVLELDAKKGFRIYAFTFG